MEPQHLALLRDLALHGTVTAVAAATCRTPSAVSQQLKVAQRRAGVALVEPDGRGLRLTAAGRLAAELGQEVEVALARAAARWDAYRGASTGAVRVAAFPSAAALLLPRVLGELAAVGVEVVCDDVDVAEREYAALVTTHDIVIAHSLDGPTPRGAEGLRCVPLAREPLDLAMAAGHRLAVRPSVTAVEAAGETWVGVPSGYPFDAVARAVAAKAGRGLRVAQRVRDNRLVEALVAASDHVAVLGRLTTPSGGGVVLRPLADVPATRHVVAVLRPDRAERLVVATALDALRRAGAAAQ
ncbi:LysR family transcriptional regulator [Xylanimonas ulmi]|uniref:DNA-binding transcriptional LysR family regulator n=1 Tax=Xylanimonas ulmi TaxID=228973 RepID=A0A4Q7M2N2_9MICO|nr:LysR family transcriptional regulator [Xylanibacterium ulmi]RZS60169.1 DNA-binding transcriptional LysR family regulator [Xylanibacterium ulmi]